MSQPCKTQNVQKKRCRALIHTSNPSVEIECGIEKQYILESQFELAAWTEEEFHEGQFQLCSLRAVLII